MAALVLTCCGLLSSRINKKRSARKEREMEYSANFETLKEENAKRMRQLSASGVPGYESVTSGVGASVVESNNHNSRSSNLAQGPSLESVHGGGGGSIRTLDQGDESASAGDWRHSGVSGEMRMLPSYDDAVQSGGR